MSGFISDLSVETNRIEEAKQARIKKHLPLIDLSCANPTKHGLLFPTDILIDGAKEYFSKREYTPDPKGLLEAREAISAYYRGRKGGADIKPDNVFITASTSESYNLLFTLLGATGDNVIGPEVTYPLFDLFAEARGLELRTYKMVETGDWAIDEESLHSQIDWQSRGILIVSPHNPTGKIHRESISVIRDSTLPLICDEVFAEFTLSGETAPLLLSLYQNQPAFVLNGISKMFALPDMKLGWIVLNDIALEIYGERLEILNDCFLSCSSFTQSLVPGLFRDGMAFMSELKGAIRHRVNFATEKLQDQSSSCLSKPEGGAFVFPMIRTHIDEEDFVVELINQGVYVHPGYFYGYENKTHIMISCIVEEEKLLEGIDIITDVIQKARLKA